MKPIKKTLIFLYLFITVTAVGQNNPIQPDLIPPSPQAAQFIRYGEIPVGYTTGVPQNRYSYLYIKNRLD